MIYQNVDRIAVGTRFRMSEVGAARCPELANRSGIVIEESPRTTGITVLFDGAQRPTCLHREFISPISGREIAAPPIASDE
ncbi:hypothetical protein ABID59_001956 [Bradyrhizobium sp. S3.3.6]|uniref:hypothetical protein n=1 Tax=Bradyrhizobium cytisi TaxID=515489 RepID=UPI0011E6A675|nr:hypothetical protein [Bradyrhizobium cytisi]